MWYAALSLSDILPASTSRMIVAAVYGFVPLPSSIVSVPSQVPGVTTGLPMGERGPEPTPNVRPSPSM